MADRDLKLLTRRHFFQNSGLFGIGSAALASLLNESLFADTKGLHHPAKAKSVIFLFMAGAPSQLDLFDYKPKLNQLHMQPCPDDLLKGQRFAFIKGHPRLLGSPYKFAQHGKSGAWVSELLPHVSELVDDLEKRLVRR